MLAETETNLGLDLPLREGRPDLPQEFLKGQKGHSSLTFSLHRLEKIWLTYSSVALLSKQRWCGNQMTEI